MASTYQDAHWIAPRYQPSQSPERQYHGQRQPMAPAYQYSYDAHPQAQDMMMPIMYHYDPYYQPQQHQAQSWNRQTMPYGMSIEDQSVMQMPMPGFRPQSMPASPTAWPPSPSYWQSTTASHNKLTQITPISPQHGPPRRPIQSRHALWVGNIPSHTPILALRDHFLTPDTASDILSVVFTPSSNSGFINFRSADACKASMRRFNKTFLYGVPLNCRTRKTSISSASTSHDTDERSETLSVEAADSLISANSCDSDQLSPTNSSANGESSIASSDIGYSIEKEDTTSHEVTSKLEKLNVSEGRNRYFIIKSLTYDDLLNSVKSRRWSTQVQNESLLDDAFKAGDFVYLIFSVNRSREYFGYARMTSATEFDSAPIVTSNPYDQSAQHLPQAAKPPIVRTPAAGHIPAGRIIDELCRGKIFWEIDDVITDNSTSAAATASTGSNSSTLDSNGEAVITSGSTTTGLQKSFAIDWLSLKRIPFRQTTHLKNLLNENKEVKIARDGTELDADVGRKLCSLFHLSS